MRTTIVNIKSGAKYDIYGGRPGPLGNPYVIGDFAFVGGAARLIRTRDEACDLYEKDFARRILVDNDLRRVVLSCYSQVLGCHCVPKRCHLQTIVNWLEKNVAAFCMSCYEPEACCICQ